MHTKNEQISRCQLALDARSVLCFDSRGAQDPPNHPCNTMPFPAHTPLVQLIVGTGNERTVLTFQSNQQHLLRDAVKTLADSRLGFRLNYKVLDS